MHGPVIIHRTDILLAGFSFFGDPFSASAAWTEENEIGRLWNRLRAFLAGYPGLENPGGWFEAHIEHPDTPRTGHYEVFAGWPVAGPQDLPPQLLVKRLPAGQYALFEMTGTEAASDWIYWIYQQWLPGSGYRAAHPFNLLEYPAGAEETGDVQDTWIKVYVPVSPAVPTGQAPAQPGGTA
ncbi:MAG: GyrI-like domain-containing protein [Anaerolineaceae bacterium]|nr:GyrI-like domain-containing protein [Anaerolineaceae bacterium]